MTEQIIRKFNRRVHLLNFISPYRLSDEQIALGAIADLGRSCEGYLERIKEL